MEDLGEIITNRVDTICNRNTKWTTPALAPALPTRSSTHINSLFLSRNPPRPTSPVRQHSVQINSPRYRFPENSLLVSMVDLEGCLRSVRLVGSMGWARWEERWVWADWVWVGPRRCWSSRVVSPPKQDQSLRSSSMDRLQVRPCFHSMRDERSTDSDAIRSAIKGFVIRDAHDQENVQYILNTQLRQHSLTLLPSTTQIDLIPYFHDSPFPPPSPSPIPALASTTPNPPIKFSARPESAIFEPDELPALGRSNRYCLTVALGLTTCEFVVSGGEERGEVYRIFLNK